MPSLPFRGWGRSYGRPERIASADCHRAVVAGASVVSRAAGSVQCPSSQAGTGTKVLGAAQVRATSQHPRFLNLHAKMLCGEPCHH